MHHARMRAAFDQGLRPADPAELADSLAYAIRFDERGTARRIGVKYASKIDAEQFVQCLLADGFVLMRRHPPARIGRRRRPAAPNAQ